MYVFDYQEYKLNIRFGHCLKIRQWYIKNGQLA